MDRSMMSADFKRDYVAFAAVVLFFLIVAGEVYIAFFIPMYVENGSALATQENRQRMIDSFDWMRNSIYRNSAKKEDVKDEIELIYWNLNMLANYLRAYSDTMTPEEIADMRKDLGEMNKIYGRLQSGKNYNRAEKLDFTPPLDRLADQW